MASSSFLCLAYVLVVQTTLALDANEPPCPQWQRNDITNAIFLRNGSVEDVDAGELYPLGTYWFETVNKSVRLFGCPCKLGKPCLRKCCAWDQMMDIETLECIAQGGSSRHWFRPILGADPYLREIKPGEFGITYGKYCFGYLLEPDEYPEDEFYLDARDGTLQMPISKKIGLDTSTFCLEYINNINRYLPYVCFEQLGKTVPEFICVVLRYSIYPLGMGISIIFLVISLIIYSTTSELRNLPGKCLMCHMASLLVEYLFQAIVHSAGGSLNENVCTAFGFVIYFALLCSFFWLNVMCFDLYFTFSSFIPPRLQNSESRKFFTYRVYAWGLPFLIIVVTAVMELHPEGESGRILKPQFNKDCWFSSRSSILAYFIAPVGVIVTCNVILFALTAINIYKVNRETSVLKGVSSLRSREDRNMVKLYLKLFMVMGLSWVLVIISYIAGRSMCMWLSTSAVNTIQSTSIYMIFVRKRNVINIMKSRLRKLITKLRYSFSHNNDSNLLETDTE